MQISLQFILSPLFFQISHTDILTIHKSPSPIIIYLLMYHAAMAELADALDSGSSRGNPLDVRLILAAYLITHPKRPPF